VLPLQDADTKNCCGGTQQLFLPELPEDTTGRKKKAAGETRSATQHV